MSSVTEEASKQTVPIPADQMNYLIATAARAPSAHNTQPWRFRVSDYTIDLYADPCANFGWTERPGDGHQLRASPRGRGQEALVRQLENGRQGDRRRWASRARSSAALAAYRVSIARDFHPASRIRSPSDPPNW